MFRIAEFTGMINSLHPIAWPAKSWDVIHPTLTLYRGQRPRDKSQRQVTEVTEIKQQSLKISMLSNIKFTDWTTDCSESISSSLIGQHIE